MNGMLNEGRDHEALRRWRNVIIVAVLLAASALGWWLRSPAAPVSSLPSIDAATAAAASQALLARSLPDHQGRPQSWQQWQGQILVINLWATWCPPCREEMPGFVRLQARYQGHGVQFIGLAVDEAAAVVEFLRQMPLNYPVLFGDDALLQLFAGFGNRQGALPYTIILDPQGRLLRAHQGLWREARLTQVLAEVLQEQ